MTQKFAAHNPQGQITAFYDDIDSPVPAGITAIAITDAQWQTCLSQPGWAVANGALVAPVPPTDAELLASAQAAQIAILKAAYQTALQQPVTYTSQMGISKAFDADAASQAALNTSLTGYAVQGGPSGFYWVAHDNSPVPFSLADLQGLAAAIATQGWAAFRQLQTCKAAIKAAGSVAAVQNIVWR